MFEKKSQSMGEARDSVLSIAKQLLSRRRVVKRHFVEVEIVESGHQFSSITIAGKTVLLANELIVTVEDDEN